MAPESSHDAPARAIRSHSSSAQSQATPEEATNSFDGTSSPAEERVSADHLHIGSLLAGRYELEHVLGSGAYGQVFQAWDTIRRRKVAIKVLRDNSADALLQFKQEFRALTEIRHRNLIRFLKLGRAASDSWYLVMELIEGSALTATSTASQSADMIALALESTQNNNSQLEPTGAFDPEQEDIKRVYEHEIAPLFAPELIRSRIAQIGSGLRALHSAGVIHCDLKPSNVLISATGRVVILDFGVARYTRHLGAHHQAPRANAGTRPYMSPEFRSGDEPHPGVDWYATGMMLAELLTGLSPAYISALSFEERSNAFSVAAEQFPDHAQLFELANALLHPSVLLRANGQDVLRVCGDSPASFEREEDSFTFPFMRRERELEHLLAMWTRYLSGQPTHVVVEGVAGIGKTALCREFVQEVTKREQPPIVLVARCRTDELLGYRAFDELVDGVASVLRQMSDEERQPFTELIGNSLAELFPTLRPFKTTTKENLKTPPEAALRELHSLLRNLTTQQDAIIWIEDIHLADEDSLRWFAQIFAPGQSPRAFLMFTRRPSENARLTDHFDIDTLGYAIPIFRLTPLDDQFVEATIRKWLPEGIANREEVIRHLTRFGKGHPYLLRELCRDTELAKSMTSSTTLTRLLRARLERLSALDSLVLVTMASSSVALTRTQIAQVANVTLEDVDDAIDRLESELLIWQVSSRNNEEEVYEISQRSITDTILHLIEPEMLADIHLRHAQLGMSGTIHAMPAATIVSHFVRGGNLIDARSFAEKTAESALARGAWAIGAQMHDILLQIARDSGQKPSKKLRENAIECRLRTGRGVDAAKLLLELAAETTDSEARTLRRRAAEAMILSGHVSEGLRINQTAMPPGLKAPMPFVPSIVDLFRLDRQLHKRLSNYDFDSVATPNEVNEEHTAHLDTYRMLGIDLGLVDAVQAYHYTIRELHAALDSRSTTEILRALSGYCAYTNMNGGEAERRVRNYLKLARRLAEKDGNLLLLHWLRICEGTIDYHNGAYMLGWEKIQPSYAWMHENASDQQMMLAYLEQHRLFCCMMFLDTEGLRKSYYQQLVNARTHHNRLLETSMTLVGFQTWLIDDVPEAAAAVLERVHWRGPTKGFQLYDYLRLRAETEIVLYQGTIGPELDYLIDRWLRFEGTLLARTVRLCLDEGRYLHARLLLLRARRDGRFSTRDRLTTMYIIKSLTAQSRALAQGWGHSIAANLYFADRKFGKAHQSLRKAESIFQNAHLDYYASAARVAGHVSKVWPQPSCPIAEMRNKGVIAPDRITRANHPLLG